MDDDFRELELMVDTITEIKKKTGELLKLYKYAIEYPPHLLHIPSVYTTTSMCKLLDEVKIIYDTVVGVQEAVQYDRNAFLSWRSLTEVERRALLLKNWEKASEATQEKQTENQN